MRVRNVKVKESGCARVTEVDQLHSFDGARAGCAEERIEFPDAPQAVAVRVTSEDHQPLAAEDEDRQTFQRSGDVALVDVDLVQPQDRLASVLALKPCVTI